MEQRGIDEGKLIKNNNIKDKAVEVEKRRSLQRDKCECVWLKSKKLPHKWPRSILCAQSTF